MFQLLGAWIRLEIKLSHILTSGDLELDPIKLNLFSSDRRTINIHFDGLSDAVGWFIVMIGHLECIQSSIFAIFLVYIFFTKSWIARLLPGFRRSTLAKNVSQMVYYQK